MGTKEVDVIRRAADGDLGKAMLEVQEELAKHPASLWDMRILHDDDCPCLSGGGCRSCNCSPEIVATKIKDCGKDATEAG